MSIRVYSAAYPEQLPAETFQSLLVLLPPDMAGKVRRFHRWEDAYGALFGKLLLMTALQDLGMSFSLHDLGYSAYGRPSLPNGPDFNISHSGHAALCIIGQNSRVGIDVEEMRQLDIQDFKEQFHPEEWAAILNAPSPLHHFYHLWTSKECISKADGRGLNIPLADIHITPGVPVRLPDNSWYIRDLPFLKNYACHAAADRPLDELVYTQVDIKKLGEILLKK